MAALACTPSHGTSIATPVAAWAMPAVPAASEADATGNIAPVAFLQATGTKTRRELPEQSVNSLFVNAPNTPQAYNGQAVSYMQYDQPIPQLYNWNVTVQRQLTRDMMAADRLRRQPRHEPALQHRSRSGAGELLLCDHNDARLRGPIRNIRPSADSTPMPHPIYHALQAQFQRRMSNGLTFNVNYTWSHMTDNQDSSGWGSQQGTTIWQNAYDPQCQLGRGELRRPSDVQGLRYL